VRFVNVVRFSKSGVSSSPSEHVCAFEVRFSVRRALKNVRVEHIMTKVGRCGVLHEGRSISRMQKDCPQARLVRHPIG
jgi:hypothetical protein